ncbi:MarC family protein [Martelella sp. HB161492]|uniref:MarC family protein n=1 Tax=Martelella sp. HB161492 TaxID=2720726 RepID=UPI00159104F4|nr:MarC family protein [Martelella sp. HB161492]
MATLSTLANGFTTLMVTIDPPGLIPLFIGLTAGMNRLQRRQVAFRASVISFLLLVVFAVFGEKVLNALGISMSAFRIAGGILLFWIGVEMIFEKRQERKEKVSEVAITQDHIANIAVFPLAMPLIAGPGSISATILLGSRMHGFVANMQLIVVLLIAAVITFASLLLAGLIDRALGQTGRNILTRILGMVLTALAVQFVIDGIVTAFGLHLVQG